MAEDMLYTDESNGQEYLAVEKTTHAEDKHQVVTPAEDDNSVVMSDKLLVRNAEDEIVWKMPQDLSEYAKLSDLSANVKLAFVDELPEEPEENVIYLVKKEDGEDPNIYNEYLYHEGSGFELIGDTSTDVDLSDLEERIGNLETELPKKANSNHVHGFIQNDGTFNNSNPNINRNMDIEATSGDRLLIVDNSNKEKINTIAPFVAQDADSANQYLSRDGQWKDIEGDTTEIKNEDENKNSKGWLGNDIIEIDGSASEIFGYIITGGTVIAGRNKDIIHFSITKQSLEDMFNYRVVTNAIEESTGKIDTIFHENLIIPTASDERFSNTIEVRIQIDISQFTSGEKGEILTWDASKKILLSLTRCVAFKKDIIGRGSANEQFNYINGMHKGAFNYVNDTITGLARYSSNGGFSWAGNTLSTDWTTILTDFLSNGFPFIKETPSGGTRNINNNTFIGVSAREATQAQTDGGIFTNASPKNLARIFVYKR